MNEQLQTALAQIIIKATEGLSESINFLSGQLPDVIHQLLVWYALSSFIHTVFGVTLSAILFYMLCKYSGVGEKVDDKYGSYYKETLTHDREGDFGHGVLTLPIGVCVSMIPLAMANLTWLKIMIAPKIWLIEYASSLVK